MVTRKMKDKIIINNRLHAGKCIKTFVADK